MKKLLLLSITIWLVSSCVSVSAQTDPNVLPTIGNVGIGTTTPISKLEVMGTVHIDSTLKVSDSLSVTGNTKLGQDLKVEGNLYLTNLPSYETATGVLEPLFKSADGAVYKGPILATQNAAIPCLTLPDGSFANVPFWISNVATASLYTGFCSNSKVGIETDLPRVSLDNRGTTYSNRLALGNADPLAMIEYFSLKINSSPATAYPLMAITSGVNNLFTLNSSGLVNTKFVQTSQIGINVDPSGASQIGVFHIKTNLPNTNTTPVFLIENQVNKLFQLNNNGHVYARQIRVNLDNAWPDYVFKKNYKLMTPLELESFINQNGHLPNVPSESEIQKTGLDLGESNRVLLEKVEELTLYMIQQQKMLDEMKLELEKLHK